MAVDVIFMLDRSHNIDNAQWQRQVDFVEGLLAPFDVAFRGRNSSRVAITTFSDTQSYDLPWQDVNMASWAMQQLFGPRGLKARSLGGLTFVREALESLDRGSVIGRVRDLNVGSSSGHIRDRSEMVHRVIVVVTDGKPAAGHEGEAAAAALRAHHHSSIIAIGVGSDVNRDELAAISGQTTGHRWSSLRPQPVHAGFNVAVPGEHLKNVWKTICPTCDADVVDDCDRDISCSDATTRSQCRGTCCGSTAEVRLPSSSASSDDVNSGWDGDKVVIIVCLVGVLLCAVIVVLHYDQRQAKATIAAAPGIGPVDWDLTNRAIFSFPARATGDVAVVAQNTPLPTPADEKWTSASNASTPQLHGKRFSFATAPDPTAVQSPSEEPIAEDGDDVEEADYVAVRSLQSVSPAAGDDDDEPDSRGGAYVGLQHLSGAALAYATADEQTEVVGAGRRTSTVGPAFGGAVTHTNPLAALGALDEDIEEGTDSPR